jgi:hypothetical protein
MTQHINTILEAALGIHPSANTPLYIFDYPPQELQRL